MINVLPDGRSIQMLSEPRMNSHEAIGIYVLEAPYRQICVGPYRCVWGPALGGPSYSAA